MITKLRSLHKNESGQSIVFSAITFLFLAMFVFMVLNVGDITSKKMRLTNNADAVAVSGATWMCRGYNLTAMLNVSMSQILAIIILMKSFKRADDIGKKLCQAQEAVGEALMDIPYTAAIGAVLYSLAAGQYYILDYVGDVYEEVAEELEGDGDGILWDIMDYLQDAEEITVDVIPFVAQIEAVKTGISNGATIGFLYPTIPLVDLKLPFIDEDERKFESLCRPTATEFNWRSIPEATKIGKVGDIGMEGQKNIEHMPTTNYVGIPGRFGEVINWLAASPDGFGPAPLEYFKAYLIYPLMRAIPPFVGAVYDGVVRATYTSMCTDQPGKFSYQKVTTDCQECKQHADDIVALTYKKNAAFTLRRSVNSIDQIVEEHDCECGSPSPCRVVDTVRTEDGREEEICKYYSVKVEGRDVWLEDECGSQNLEGNDAKVFFSWFKREMNSDCEIVKIDNNYYVDPDAYGLEVREGDQKNSLGQVRTKKFVVTKLASCTYQTEEEVSQDEAWGSRSSDSDKPKPFLLNREKDDNDDKEYWEKHKDYVGIVYQLPQDNIVKIKAGLDNPNPVGMVFFSQAEIYVPEGVEPHLFNQCWQVRLVRFTKFEELFENLNSSSVSQALETADQSDSGAIGKFMNLLNALKEMFSGKLIIH